MEGISHVRSTQETVPASSKKGERGGWGGGGVRWGGGIGGKFDSNSPFCRYVDHIDFAPVHPIMLIKMIYSFIVIILFKMPWGQSQHGCCVCKANYYNLVDLIALSFFGCMIMLYPQLVEFYKYTNANAAI